MQPVPSWTNPLALQIAPNLKKSPSTERQRHHNPHENEYWQHFQQQGDGACVSRIAGPEKGWDSQIFTGVILEKLIYL
jgi:hypothetical protein